MLALPGSFNEYDRVSLRVHYSPEASFSNCLQMLMSKRQAQGSSMVFHSDMQSSRMSTYSKYSGEASPCSLKPSAMKQSTSASSLKLLVMAMKLNVPVSSRAGTLYMKSSQIQSSSWPMQAAMRYSVSILVLSSKGSLFILGNAISNTFVF